MASILQSGKLAASANSTTLAVTFSTSGGTGAASSGNKIVVLIVADNAVSGVAGNGGAAGTFAQQAAGSGFCDVYAYDLSTGTGGQTGFTITQGGTSGCACWWYELTGVNLTVDKASFSNSVASTQNLPVGSVTPTATDIILWAAGVDSGASLFLTTSVGTFDGSVASTESTANKVCIGAGHTTSASTTAPTVHNNSSSSTAAGVIVAYQPGSAALSRPVADTAGSSDAVATMLVTARASAAAAGLSDAVVCLGKHTK